VVKAGVSSRLCSDDATLLTARIARAARPRERRYLLADEHGMSLHVMPRGSKWSRFRYRLQHAERMISLGVYPNVNLATAHLLHADARALLARDIDPSKCVPAAIPDTPLRLDSAESQSRRAPGRELRARCPRRILSAISKIVWGAGNVGRSTRIGNRPGGD